MKKIIKASLLAGMILTVSCQQNDVLTLIDHSQARNSYIEFSNYVGTMTRASKTPGNNSFVSGDTMAVWGIQKTGNQIDHIFINQPVRYISGTTWTYDNKKLWNDGSKYVFYGVFPYSKTLYTVSNDTNRYVTIANYTTPDAPAQQTDLLISERRVILPQNTVDMIFHHILSNVSIYAKIGNGFDTTGVSQVMLTSMQLKNIKSTGTYTQTAWNQDCAQGSWTGITGTMNIPAATDKVLTFDATPVYADYLMIPQTLFSADATPQDVAIDAVFRIFYRNGTSSTCTKKNIRLAGITGNNGTNNQIISSWESNFRYNYTLAFTPHKSTRTWEADGDGSIQIDPATGDTLSTTNDTPYSGTMRYNPDEPDIIYIFEDSNNDTIPDTWKSYPIVWEDVDGDGLLEAGLDRDGDGHIDNVDGDTTTQQLPGGDPDKDPSDGSPSNPTGKDVILIHYDSDGDGDVDDNDEWIQIQKDPNNGVIRPGRETEEPTIEFTATVSEWEQKYSIDYSINR